MTSPIGAVSKNDTYRASIFMKREITVRVGWT